MTDHDGARLLVVPLDVPAGLDAPAVAAALTAVGSQRVVALSGDWAGGGELVTADPSRVVAPTTAAQAFAVTDRQPLVDVPDALEGAVGGGWFGYLGFGLSADLWRRPPPVPATRLLPVASWAWHDWVLRRPAGDTWRFEALVGPGFGDEAAHAVRRRLEVALASHPGAPDAGTPGPVAVRVLSRPDRTRHVVAVEECVRAVRRGDVYQANITGGLDLALEGRSVDAWGLLVRRLRPARAAFVEVPGGALAGASPELFLTRRGRRVVSAPVKGTRPATAEGEDAVLRGSVKDAAENVMIVDLVRNDLSAACRPGTVAVSGLLDVAPHAGVWHLVSTVEGELPAGTPNARLLAATFPPASVTGVPKLRALEVMAAAEGEARGAYTGAVGFASPVAGLELAVTIRTLEIAGGSERGRARLGVGGGVTAGSTPVEEWAECLVKAAPLLAALGAPPGTHDTAPDAGAALFETVLVRDGVVLEAADHTERLARSWWELTRTPAPPGVPAALAAAARALPAGWHRLRVDAGAHGLRTTAAPVPPPRPLAARPGLELRAAAVGVLGLPRHKLADRADLEALEAGVSDHDREAVLLVDPAGLVLESTRANVLAVTGGVLCTPPLDGRVLPGVTRQVLLDLAADLGVPVRVAPLPLAALLDADGVLLTNAVRGVRWGQRLGERRWEAPDALAVALTAALLARWRAPWDAPGVRLSEFWILVDEEFGRAQGRTLVRDHVVGALGHRTAEQALDAGDDPREVWLALAADLEVPEERWWGRDPAAAQRRRR